MCVYREQKLQRKLKSNDAGKFEKNTRKTRFYEINKKR